MKEKERTWEYGVYVHTIDLKNLPGEDNPGPRQRQLSFQFEQAIQKAKEAASPSGEILSHQVAPLGPTWIVSILWRRVVP